jgi:uncharacterized damage-inducible protein DinB
MLPGMQARAWATLMAEYNRWMNEKLYALASQLGDEERKRDLGAFFRSLHGTLDHVLMTDRIFVARLRGEKVPAFVPGQLVHEDFGALRAEREVRDEEILAWARALEDGALERMFRFGRTTPRMLPLYVVVAQMFNHQTHHRGQATALLTRLGVDPGVTDLPFMPYVDQLARPPE